MNLDDEGLYFLQNCNCILYSDIVPSLISVPYTQYTTHTEKQRSEQYIRSLHSYKGVESGGLIETREHNRASYRLRQSLSRHAINIFDKRFQ